MPATTITRRQFKSRMATKQDVWRAIPALLGDGNGTVEVPGQPGMVYIRVGDGDLGQAFNNRCQLRDNLAVYVGYDPITDPDRRIFQVLTVRMADYAGAGYTPVPNVGPHGTTHYFGGGDDVYVEWRRLMGLRVGRPSAFVVTVDPGIFYSAGAWTEIPATTVDLTADHAALVGVQAQYVLISLSSAGVVTSTAGAAVASIALLTMADCPSPPAGHIPLAAVRLYKVQTSIDDVPAAPDIVDLRFPTYACSNQFWNEGHVTFVPHGANIQTYVNAATAGDTLVLASGEYVITSTITIGKQLNIVGQGNAGFYTIPYAAAHGTIISSTTNAIVAFQINSSNVRIAGMSINLTGNASTGINTAKDLTGLVLHNIDVIVTCNGLAQGFTVWSSNIVMRNLSFYITSLNTAAYGFWFLNDNTSTINAIADCFNVTGTVLGAGTAAYCFACENVNDANTLTLNLESCAVRALNGTPLDIAVASISTTTSNSTVNCYLCTLEGANYDAYQNNANVLNLGGSVLVNNLVFGTVTYRAAMAAGLGVFSTSITLGATADMSIEYSAGQGNIHTDLTADSDLHIDCGTDKTLVLDEVVWDDIRVTPGSFDRPGTSDPTIVAYDVNGGGVSTYLWQFDLNNLASFTVQLPHSYKQGEDISVHIHWTPGPRGVAENGNTVGWKIDYSWANINANFPTMSTADLSDACDGTNHKHQMTPEVAIDGHTVSKNISSMLICNVKRTDTGADDTWVGTISGERPMLLEIDFHFPIDTIGSRQASAK